jgi:ATP-dependent Clp protease ATP-binding subunit ClpC
MADMWKQLTQEARKAIFLAQEEAGKLGYSHVGPEHLLLALIREDDCVAAQIMERSGVDLGTVRAELMEQLSRGDETLAEGMQLTSEAKHAIDMAFEAGRQANAEHIGTEHLLMGLAGEPHGVAADVLAVHGIDGEHIRRELRGIQAGTLPFERNNGGSARISIA